MPVNLKKGLGFIHIPRNGGTTVEHLMGVHENRPDWGLGSKNLNRSGDLEYLIGSDTQHLSHADMVDLLGDKGLSLYWFAVIRNPKDRLISVICYMLGRPDALTSKKKLLGSFRTIIKLWLRFYMGNLRSSLFHFRSQRQVSIHDPIIQHLMPQQMYLDLNFSDLKNSETDVSLYPFEEISRISQHVEGLDTELPGTDIPNKSNKKPAPNQFNLKLIRWFSAIFYRKDYQLYHNTLQNWKAKGEPLKLTQYLKIGSSN